MQAFDTLISILPNNTVEADAIRLIEKFDDINESFIPEIENHCEALNAQYNRSLIVLKSKFNDEIFDNANYNFNPITYKSSTDILRLLTHQIEYFSEINTDPAIEAQLDSIVDIALECLYENTALFYTIVREVAKLNY